VFLPGVSMRLFVEIISAWMAFYFAYWAWMGGWAMAARISARTNRAA
jgi:hypothetical protein